jgi:pimeloyl-ACP methyl ester carboxylesterase
MGDDPGFPVGYHNLHPDATLNFQLNRFWNWVGEPQMLEELRRVAPSLSDYAEWTRQLPALGERALAEGRMLAGAYLIRTGEFFMSPNDPRRGEARRTFLDNVLREFGVAAEQHHAVPYFGRALSAYRLTPASQPRGVVVVFGGFDSCIEEWLPILLALRDAGRDVIAFDGPGQGAALEAGLPMTADWHEPVRAVLDHFGVDDVTLMGFSLGGCLVMRAAALEPRVSRIIADDILTNFTACFAYRLPAPQKTLVGNAHRFPAAVVDALINHARSRNMFVDWGIGNAEWVFGVDTPAKALAAVRGMRTDDVSARITQDVLLMAGAEDHYVPLWQLGAQIHTLTNARSVTARVFTCAESAQNHCQVGNLGLALRVILAWLAEFGG